MNMDNHANSLKWLSLGFLGLIVTSSVAYAAFYSMERYDMVNLELESTREALDIKNVEFAKATKDISVLQSELTYESEKNTLFENEINKIGSTVGTLKKLAETDPQLLSKYSKVYFLNEHYVPSSLVALDEKYVFEEGKEIEIHAKVYPFFQELISSAKADDISIKVISGYRSYKSQEALKAGYKVTYGSGTANAFSADQGYSEHQLGTALDVTSERLGTGFTNFEKDPAYQWLLENAWKSGFVLSYPKNNNYYTFEPWHWRFVGEKLARELNRNNQSFYDMDQRLINSYLVDIFE